MVTVERPPTEVKALRDTGEVERHAGQLEAVTTQLREAEHMRWAAEAARVAAEEATELASHREEAAAAALRDSLATVARLEWEATETAAAKESLRALHARMAAQMAAMGVEVEEHEKGKHALAAERDTLLRLLADAERAGAAARVREEATGALVLQASGDRASAAAAAEVGTLLTEQGELRGEGAQSKKYHAP
jgi:hypothetical protein